MCLGRTLDRIRAGRSLHDTKHMPKYNILKVGHSFLHDSEVGLVQLAVF